MMMCCRRGRVRVQLADEGGGALVDQGLQLRNGDVGEGEVEDFVGLGGQGGEVPVEEDGVENAADDVADRGGVSKGLEDELLRDLVGGGRGMLCCCELVHGGGSVGSGGEEHVVVFVCSLGEKMPDWLCGICWRNGDVIVGGSLLCVGGGVVVGRRRCRRRWEGRDGWNVGKYLGRKQ